MTSYILYSFHIDVTLAPYIYIFLYRYILIRLLGFCGSYIFNNYVFTPSF